MILNTQQLYDKDYNNKQTSILDNFEAVSSEFISIGSENNINSPFKRQDQIQNNAINTNPYNNGKASKQYENKLIFPSKYQQKQVIHESQVKEVSNSHELNQELERSKGNTNQHKDVDHVLSSLYPQFHATSVESKFHSRRASGDVDDSKTYQINKSLHMPEMYKGRGNKGKQAHSYQLTRNHQHGQTQKQPSHRNEERSESNNLKTLLLLKQINHSLSINSKSDKQEADHNLSTMNQNLRKILKIEVLQEILDKLERVQDEKVIGDKIFVHPSFVNESHSLKKSQLQQVQMNQSQQMQSEQKKKKSGLFDMKSEIKYQTQRSNEKSVTSHKKQNKKIDLPVSSALEREYHLVNQIKPKVHFDNKIAPFSTKIPESEGSVRQAQTIITFADINEFKKVNLNYNPSHQKQSSIEFDFQAVDPMNKNRMQSGESLEKMVSECNICRIIGKRCSLH